MRNTSRWYLACSLLAGLVVIPANGQITNTTPPAAEPKARLEFTLVANPDEKKSAVEVEDRTQPGKKILVLKQPILDQTAIASAQPVQIDGKNAVSLKMTKDGGAKLKAATSSNIGRKFAIVFDGKLIFAP